MSDGIRFHLDESVDPAIANGLRLRGVDVTTSHQAELLGASDEKQLDFALVEGRMLVTHDEDFLVLARDGIAHSGIAYCRPGSRSADQNIAALLLIRDCLTSEDMKDHVEFL
jgi:predicted nuclease of predicted toxin-antitoxin system